MEEIKALGLSAYLAEYQDEPIFLELKPYCVRARIESPYINMQSIRATYGFGCKMLMSLHCAVRRSGAK